MSKRTVSVRAEETLLAQLGEVAQKRYVSRSWLIEQIIRGWLAHNFPQTEGQPVGPGDAASSDTERNEYAASRCSVLG
ncbi:ribbon-helix-helix domain-containing protein [Beijerinckia indica]|uniref:ribbon-helix-helix domain-containing protein n=1 Tax=Beijerinckia indica TaxID=533 RepID=UPI0009D661E0